MTFPVNYPYAPKLMKLINAEGIQFSELVDLDISGCWLCVYLKRAGHVQLCEFLKHCSNVASLNLSGNNLWSLIKRGRKDDEEGYLAFEALFSMLLDLPKLNMLNLSYNGPAILNEEGFKYLSSIFTKCLHLKQIVINGDGFTTAQIQALQALSSINICREKITEKNQPQVPAAPLCWQFGEIPTTEIAVTISSPPIEVTAMTKQYRQPI